MTINHMISPVKIWRRQKEIRKLLAKRGRVLTWTKIFITGPDFKKYAPYIVVMVEFSDNQRSVGQLVECREKDLKFGMPVISLLRKVRDPSPDGVIAYGLKFKPII